MVEQPKAPERKRSRLGIWIASIYLVVVLVVYILTAITTTRDKVGYDWIPFWMLAMPWSGMASQLLLPGFLINAGVLYLFGTLLQALRRRVSSP